MMTRDHMRASLRAALPPVGHFEIGVSDRPTASRSIKDAIRNMEREAEKLREEVRGELPFHQTLHDIVERM